MMVQIFQNTELNDIMFTIEGLAEWKQIAEQLGATSQLDFVKHADTPIPYPYINTGMRTIFKTLCPTGIDFKSYNKTPIPLEVLRQISFSVNDKHFTRIEIWYDDKKIDPIAVGVSEKYYVYDTDYKHLKDVDGKDVLFETPEQGKFYADAVDFKYKGAGSTEKNEYLIARWADELRPIEELKELARERLLEKYGAELKNEIEEKTRALNKLKENVTLFLAGEITEGILKGGKW